MAYTLSVDLRSANRDKRAEMILLGESISLRHEGMYGDLATEAARFRDVTFGHGLCAGDDLTGDAWDHRDWQGQLSTREKLFWLAAEACLELR